MRSLWCVPCLMAAYGQSGAVARGDWFDSELDDRTWLGDRAIWINKVEPT